MAEWKQASANSEQELKLFPKLPAGLSPATSPPCAMHIYMLGIGCPIQICKAKKRLRQPAQMCSTNLLRGLSNETSTPWAVVLPYRQMCIMVSFVPTGIVLVFREGMSSVG